MCGVFRAGRMPARKIPPAPRTRCAAPGAQAGCAFFAPGFFAQAKKGGSRRHGAKALDLAFAATGDTQEQEQLAALAPSSALRAPSPASGRRAGTAAGAQTGGVLFAPGFFAQAQKGDSRRDGAKALDLDVGGTGTAGGSRPALRAAEDQEQLAALAPSSGASRHLLPQAGEGLFGWSAAGGRRAVRLVCRWREKGCSTDVRWREKGGIGSCGSGSGRSRAGQ